MVIPPDHYNVLYTYPYIHMSLQQILISAQTTFLISIPKIPTTSMTDPLLWAASLSQCAPNQLFTFLPPAGPLPSIPTVTQCHFTNGFSSSRPQQLSLTFPSPPSSLSSSLDTTCNSSSYTLPSLHQHCSISINVPAK